MHFPTWTPSRAPSTDVASMLKESCIAVLRRLPIKDRKIAIELAKDYHARRWIEFFEIYDQNALSQTGPTTGGVRLLVDLDEGTAEEVIALFEHEESASGAMSEETADMTSESGPAKTLLNDAAVDIHQSLEEGSMEKVSVDELGLEVTFPELQETRKTPGSETRDWSLESRDPPSSYQTPCTSPSTDIPHTTSLANLRPLPEILQDTLQEITLTVKPRKRREKKTSRAASVVSSSGLTRDSSMENLRASVDDDAAPGILKRLGTMFTWGVSAAPSPPPTASTSPETAPAADDSPPQTDPDITKKEPATKSSNSINLWGILGSRGDDDVNGPHATLAAAAAPDVQPTTTNVATASIKKKKKKIKKKKFKKELEAPVDDISDINEDATIDSGASDRNPAAPKLDSFMPDHKHTPSVELKVVSDPLEPAASIPRISPEDLRSQWRQGGRHSSITGPLDDQAQHAILPSFSKAQSSRKPHHEGDRFKSKGRDSSMTSTATHSTPHLKQSKSLDGTNVLLENGTKMFLPPRDGRKVEVSKVKARRRNLTGGHDPMIVHDFHGRMRDAKLPSDDKILTEDTRPPTRTVPRDQSLDFTEAADNEPTSSLKDLHHMYSRKIVFGTHAVTKPPHFTNRTEYSPHVSLQFKDKSDVRHHSNVHQVSAPLHSQASNLPVIYQPSAVTSLMSQHHTQPHGPHSHSPGHKLLHEYQSNCIPPGDNSLQIPPSLDMNPEIMYSVSGPPHADIPSYSQRYPHPAYTHSFYAPGVHPHQTASSSDTDEFFLQKGPHSHHHPLAISQYHSEESGKQQPHQFGDGQFAPVKHHTHAPKPPPPQIYTKTHTQSHGPAHTPSTNQPTPIPTHPLSSFSSPIPQPSLQPPQTSDPAARAAVDKFLYAWKTQGQHDLNRMHDLGMNSGEDLFDVKSIQKFFEQRWRIATSGQTSSNTTTYQ